MQNRRKGFTLTELMIVVALVGILAVIGGLSLKNRLKVARLEQAAQTMMADLSYARSTALLKGCPTRFIFCNTKNCETVTSRTTGTISGTGGTEVIGTGADAAKYYAILRQTTPCSASDLVAGDNYTHWDFDRRPQQIPSGVVARPIYTNQIPDFTDWSSTASAEALASIWFSSMNGTATVPVAGNTVEGNKIVFEVFLDDCDLATSTDCLGYFVTLGDGGKAAIKKCTPGSRSAGNNDTCF